MESVCWAGQIDRDPVHVDAILTDASGTMRPPQHMRPALRARPELMLLGRLAIEIGVDSSRAGVRVQR